MTTNIICWLFGHMVRTKWPEIWGSQVDEYTIKEHLLTWKIFYQCRNCGEVFMWPGNTPLGTDKYPMGKIRWVRQGFYK